MKYIITQITELYRGLLIETNKENNMQCPHCDYEERTWNRNTEEYVENRQGKFFTQNRVAERTDKFGDVYTRSVYGCPSCNLMFMSEYL